MYRIDPCHPIIQGPTQAGGRQDLPEPCVIVAQLWLPLEMKPHGLWAHMPIIIMVAMKKAAETLTSEAESF